MQPNSFDVIRIPTHGPGDVSGLMALIDDGALEPLSIVAVLGKTEGNGGVNDFTREYAVAALCNALSPHLKLAPREVEARIAFVMSGGTEGVLSPHVTVFARRPHLESLGENEVSSEMIGEIVMEQLRELDDVAYVRFASVYRNFREPKDFETFLGELSGEEAAAQKVPEPAREPK